jgi:hypothetical protein
MTKVEERCAALSTLADRDPDYRLTKTFPKVTHYLLTSWGRRISELSAVLFEQIEANIPGQEKERQKMEKNLRNQIRDYCEFSLHW